MSDWTSVTLGELVDRGEAELQTGPFGTALHASEYVSEGTPVIAVRHIGENRLLHDDLPKIGLRDRERLSAYLLREGDIIFGRKGAVERRALVTKAEEGWVQGSDCIRLRFRST